jgi:DnaJ-class molecular chaperone
MAKKPTTPWPHGQPTKPCNDCHGSGLSRSLAEQRIVSRDQALTDPTALRCRYCQGRGRVLTEERATR